MNTDLSAHLAELFRNACHLDVAAIKPGNVSIYADGHDMNSAHFIESADACAAVLCAPHYTLGERIFEAVRATRTVVSFNTNLGIILLCAPLIQAMLSHPHSTLRSALDQVLAHTTVDDAKRAYRAIRLAAAGGLGRVAEGDLSREPTLSLLEAMHLARHRDLIAAQYANGYQLIFKQAIPAFVEFCAKWGYNRFAVSGVFLTLLAAYPDSLVIRKQGISVAQEVCDLAKGLRDKYSQCSTPGIFDSSLLEFDTHLKQRGINPGTTADLVVATVFVADLETNITKLKIKGIIDIS